jgi:hypothetical protein
MEVGVDLYPNAGPYLKVDAGPVTVKARFGLRYSD